MTTTTTTASTSATGATSAVNVSGSTTYVTGTASGLDTASIIAAAVAQKTAPADTLDAKVTANTTKIASYQSLQSLITALSTSMSQLATPQDGVMSSTNAFGDKAVSLTASDGSTATNYVAASATSTAAAATYTISVNQLAAAQKVASTSQSSTDALGLAGSFTLAAGDGAAQTIAVTADMTINDVATAINAASSTSGVSASVIQTATGAATLVLSANDTNQSITATATSGTDILNALGFTDAGGAFANVLQAAQPAIVTVDGAQVTSDTNQLTDSISGISMSLLSTTPPGTTLSMAVNPDYSSVKTAITDFITAYNALRTFVTTNQAMGSDGTPSSSAVLFADPLLRSASQTLGSIIAGDSPSATGSLTNLADLGITLDDSNNLVLTDETTLDNALLSNLPQVASMFQSSFTTSDSSLMMLQNTSPNAFNFTMDVVGNPDGSIASVSVGGDSSLFTVDGNRIVGAAGSIYDGLSFALVTTGSSSINVDIKPGFANEITSFATQYGDTSSGLIEQQINSLTSLDTSYTTQSDQIRSDADTYQTQLVAKYATMEQEVSASQMVQAQIQAILNSSSSSTNG
jgi:flagellar hook-associated protein 2